MKAVSMLIFVFLLSAQTVFSQSVRLVLNQFGSCYYTADLLLGNDIAATDCQAIIEFENIDSVSMFWKFDSTVNVEVVKPNKKILIGDELRVTSNWVIKMSSFIYSPKIVGRICVYFNKETMPDLFYYSFSLYKEKSESFFSYAEPGDVTYDLPLSYRKWLDDYAYKSVVREFVKDIEYSINNYPNPFFKETRIKFSIPEKGKVSMYLYNENGEVADIIANDKICFAGVNYIEYQVKSDLKLGEYTCVLVVNEKNILSKKLFLIK